MNIKIVRLDLHFMFRSYPPVIVAEQILKDVDNCGNFQLILTHVTEPAEDINAFSYSLNKILHLLKEKRPLAKIYLILCDWFKHNGYIESTCINGILYFDYNLYNAWNINKERKVELVSRRWAPTNQKFLCLTGVPNRYNRVGLIYKLKQSNLLDHAIWSFPVAKNIDETSIDRIHEYVPELTRAELIKFIEDHRYSPDEQLVDNSDHPVFPSMVGINIYQKHEYFKLSHFYNSTDFSLISEGVSLSDICFITEKTWRAIINKHPFIVAGSPYTLSRLNDMGFKTFENFLEVPYYDQIVDRNARLDAAIKNAQHWLYNIANHASEINESIDHNFNLLEELYTQYIHKIENFVEQHQLMVTKDDLVPEYYNMITSEYHDQLAEVALATDQYEYDKNFCTFYKNVKADHWPECNKETDFNLLPKEIQEELCNVFGYVPQHRTEASLGM